MSDQQDAVSIAESNDGDVFPVLRADGGWDIFAKVKPEQAGALLSNGIESADGERIPVSEGSAARWLGAAAAMTAAERWPEGPLAVRPDLAQDRWLSPKLTVPRNYYTRVQWSKEYIEQDGFIDAFVERDIDIAVKRVEFQLDEEEDKGEEAKKVLDSWSTTLNEQIQEEDGLHGYNRRSAKRLIESSLIVSIANWGPIEVDGDIYQVPKVIQNLDPEVLVPYRSPFNGVTTYYYKITHGMAERLRKSRRNDIAWRQMIPRLGDNIVDALPDEVRDRHLKLTGTDQNFYDGPFIRIPPEIVYVIRFKGDDARDYPTPTLVPIFSALAMKRKLQLADWSVADGMINMLIVFSFPQGSDPDIGKSIVRSSLNGGRVQGLSIPAQVKVEIITPPADILNSKDKFWIPMSEIYAHFGFPLNSESRGAGDLESGPLDLASNAARIDRIRDVIEALDNYWLRQIKARNKWTKINPTVLIPRIDLTNSDTLRSHVLAVYDRGSISEETLLKSVGTTVEREVARRKREAAEGVDDDLEIRPSFSQTTGVPGDGRTPDSMAKPRGGAKENRPSTSAQSETRT